MEDIGPRKNSDLFKVHTNSGTSLSSLMANYPRLVIPVWYNKDLLVNSNSIVAVSKLYCVTIDTAQESFIYMISENDIMTFIEMPNGLYYHDTNSLNYCTYKLKKYVSIYYFVNTVASKLKLCSCRKMRNGDKAREL